MKRPVIKPALMALIGMVASGASVCAAPPAGTSGNHLSGDYVEARTASVFAGPCHYNGELTTTGREAEMAWSIREGGWNGVSLSGLCALAAVTSEANLKYAQPRKSVLYIDSRASEAQASALEEALRTKCAAALGEISAVKRVAITFQPEGESFHVRAEGVSKLDVDAMPNHLCCKMPNLVWYRPLIELQNSRVGYTRTSGIMDKSAGKIWQKDGQNTAFYGSFSL